MHLSHSPSKTKYTANKIKYVVYIREKKKCGKVEINAQWSCMLIKFPLAGFDGTGEDLYFRYQNYFFLVTT